MGRPVYRPNKKPQTKLSSDVIFYLQWGYWPDDGPTSETERFEYSLPAMTKQLWDAARDMILEAWIRERPGSRPWGWWEHDSPRRDTGTGAWFEPLPIPRERLGGIGTPAHQVLRYVPRFSFGIPTQWLDERQVKLYSGNAVDIFGKPIMEQFRDGKFKGVAFSDDDPPVYESQASFLKRHNLLTTEEIRVLKNRKKMFEPEKVQR
jgi:hypothetical protein